MLARRTGRAGTLSAGIHRLPEQGDTFACKARGVKFFKGAIVLATPDRPPDILDPEH